MKTKKNSILCIIALTILLIAGCGQQQSQVAYIGAETAKQTALTASGLTIADVDSIIADLTSRDGTDYYQVDLTVDGETYSYDIDALTGVVIESRLPQSEDTLTADASDTAQTADTALTTEETTVETLTADETQSSDTVQSYSISTTKSSTQSQTSTGSSTSNSTSSSTTTITVEEAKAYALSHAGLTADQVTFTKSKLDYDDGRQVYDVEFYTTDRVEYEYEIDASTGAVVNYDYESKGSSTGAVTSSTSTITESEAKAIALAQVPGATESNIREFKTDYDDGRLEYEGTIIYDGMEYEFEIDAYSGAIRSWEAEPTGR